MKLYKTQRGLLLLHEGTSYGIAQDWDTLINRDNLHEYLLSVIPKAETIPEETAGEWCEKWLLPPVGKQEVWAAGVTYLRSLDARKEEAEASGGADLYDKVYEADRPELFFKSMPERVQGHLQPVHIRRDSSWNVPEPECTLFINSDGAIQGYTIGNDMSSRSIEGENALYLPQAKVYEKSAAIGPCLYIPASPLPAETEIHMRIERGTAVLFEDTTSISRMKRTFTELVAYLYSECDFPYGSYLMTGTCLVPPAGFTLQENDRITITMAPIGTLSNTVACKRSR